MGYEKALEAAGAKVHAYEQFGSYQGDWLAKIEIDGIVKYIRDYYGSCSGCDAFEAEFGFSSHQCGEEDYYDPLYGEGGFKDDCVICQKEKKRLADFGMEYIDSAITYEECLKKISENIEWDMEAKEMIAWLQKNKEDK